ncbi:MAG: VWA domain-containing protein, partial [Lachnospiraceae bacterium]|nr:VWA domain-containing protein [Lachnospiraceae bacterium]
EQIRSYGINEDAEGMRTLIMLDNSLSIPQKSRPKIQEIMNAVIDAHSNGEKFRIATFSNTIAYMSDTYSDDYTALHNVVDNIKFNDQDTMLTDVLYGVINDLNNDGFNGYTRIMIITDGVNNKPVGGITLDRVKEELKNTPYPIYTIGCNTGKNDELLDNLFSLSWLTGCEYAVLEDSEASDITAMTVMDNDMTIYEALIPLAAQVGGKQSSKLTLGDGTQLVFDVDVPFSIKEDPTPAPTEEPKKEEKKEKKKETVEEPEEEPEEKFELPLIPIIIGGASLLAVIVAVTIILIVHSRNKKARNAANNVPVQQEDTYDKTVYLSDDKHDSNGTVLLTPQKSSGRRYTFTLTDSENPARSFRCELSDAVSIGRKPGNNIVISDDNSVHGNHCRVAVGNGGQISIMDLKDVKNHTYVNGIVLKPEIPRTVVTNTKVTIGRYTYIVNISEV